MAAFHPIAGERWLPIIECDGYEVSDLGRVRSWIKTSCWPERSSKPKLLKPLAAGEGYRAVSLWSDRNPVRRYVHRLVLEAFVEPCPRGMQTRHLNGDRADNRLANLTWGTADENTNDKFLHGTQSPHIPRPEPEPILFFDDFIPIESIIPNEVWKDIRDSPGYQVSNWGRGRSQYGKGNMEMTGRWTILSGTCPNPWYGHILLSVRTRGKKVIRSMARIVLETFSWREDTGIECRHLDGNASNNHIANLRWGTHRENMRDRSLHGTDNRGERCGSAILTTEDVRIIRRRRATGERVSVIARDYGVDPQTVSDIHLRRTWKHLE